MRRASRKSVVPRVSRKDRKIKELEEQFAMMQEAFEGQIRATKALVARHDAEMRQLVKERDKFETDKAHVMAELNRMHSIMDNMPPVTLWHTIERLKDRLS